MRTKVLLILLLGACVPTSKEALLVGKWGEGDASAFEFFDDGTVVLEPEGDRMSGTYSFLDDGRLRIEFSVMGTLSVHTYSNVDVSKEQLSLTIDRTGTRHTLMRFDGGSAAPAPSPRTKEMRNKGDLQNVCGPFRSWAEDSGLTDKPGRSNRPLDTDQVRQALSEGKTVRYILSIPEIDPWGEALEYWVRPEPWPQYSIVIRSKGADRVSDTRDDILCGDEEVFWWPR